MKRRIIKILPFVGYIMFIINMSACQSTYDSNDIPSGSTDARKSEEIYTGNTSARTESAGFQKKDTTLNNQQMEPMNSTGAPAMGSTK
jgi:hypothetical protein